MEMEINHDVFLAWLTNVKYQNMEITMIVMVQLEVTSHGGFHFVTPKSSKSWMTMN